MAKSLKHKTSDFFYDWRLWDKKTPNKIIKAASPCIALKPSPSNIPQIMATKQVIVV